MKQKLMSWAVMALIVTAFGFSTVAAEKVDAQTLWRPRTRLCGFNLLGMFCTTKMADGDLRITGYFPEDRFRWIHDWGFNYARLPLDYRFFIKNGDWMQLDEAPLYGCTRARYAAVAKKAIAAIRAVDSERFIMSDG